MNITVAVDSSDDLVRRRAEGVATDLSLPLVDIAAPTGGLMLIVTEDRLEVRDQTGPRPTIVYVDFAGGALEYRRRSAQGHSELIARAAGIERGFRTVLDATAGLGRDAFLLACCGFEVTAVERSPVLGTLLKDGLDRARSGSDAELSEVVSRIRLIVGDSCQIMAHIAPHEAPDVVYLDPMYPVGAKTSALVKKEMQVCRKLIGRDESGTDILAAGRSAAARRVVVKRPVHAPPLSEDVAFRYVGSRVRFDAYLPITL